MYRKVKKTRYQKILKAKFNGATQPISQTLTSSLPIPKCIRHKLFYFPHFVLFLFEVFFSFFVLYPFIFSNRYFRQFLRYAGPFFVRLFARFFFPPLLFYFIFLYYFFPFFICVFIKNLVLFNETVETDNLLWRRVLYFKIDYIMYKCAASPTTLCIITYISISSTLEHLLLHAVL